jgi:hypothetical protein
MHIPPYSVLSKHIGPLPDSVQSKEVGLHLAISVASTRVAMLCGNKHPKKTDTIKTLPMMTIKEIVLYITQPGYFPNG